MENISNTYKFGRLIGYTFLLWVLVYNNNIAFPNVQLAYWLENNDVGVIWHSCLLYLRHIPLCV